VCFQVLRQIQYSNKKPAYYLNRAFKLICSELNGRFTSNEYVQTLTVIHPDMSHGATDDPSGGPSDIPSSAASAGSSSLLHEDNEIVIPAHVHVAKHHVDDKPGLYYSEAYSPWEGAQKVQRNIKTILATFN